MPVDAAAVATLSQPGEFHTALLDQPRVESDLPACHVRWAPTPAAPCSIACAEGKSYFSSLQLGSSVRCLEGSGPGMDWEELATCT